MSNGRRFWVTFFEMRFLEFIPPLGRFGDRALGFCSLGIHALGFSSLGIHALVQYFVGAVSTARKLTAH